MRVCTLSSSVVSDSYDPMDCSLPGSSVYGTFQARILEWVAIPFSRGSSQPRNRTHVSCISFIGRQITTEPPGNPVKPNSDPITPQLKMCNGSPFLSEETQTLSHDLSGPTHLVLGLFSKLTSFQGPIPLLYTLASMVFLEHTMGSSPVGSLYKLFPLNSKFFSCLSPWPNPSLYLNHCSKLSFCYGLSCVLPEIYVKS